MTEDLKLPEKAAWSWNIIKHQLIHEVISNENY